jgi:hypothetical protein
MTFLCRTTLLVASLGLLPTWVIRSQTPAATESSTAAAPVAHVYIQTTKGINVYDANAAGQLSLISGSPFANSGQMEGINGAYLLSVGTDYLHSYKIEPNGAVGPHVSKIDTQSYGGSECGTTSSGGTGNGAVLDHTGEDFYVQLFGAEPDGFDTVCAAWQSYRVGSNGFFTFLGDIDYSGSAGHDATSSSIPTVSSSDKFAYGIFSGQGSSGYYTNDFSTFTRKSSGEWQVNSNFSETDPPENPNMAGGPWFYSPWLVKADPFGHLAVLLSNQSFQGAGSVGPAQLASYTINSTTGAISSTNTYANMPTPAFSWFTGMQMSPSGKILVLAGGSGLQFFHFNGASPMTTFGSPRLTNVAFDQLAWDNSNHFYALSYSSGELYVFTVTPTSISRVSGSPYKVANAYGIKGLIVAPN